MPVPELSSNVPPGDMLNIMLGNLAQLVAPKNGEQVNRVSPFNIKVDSAELSNFSQDDIARLFVQRTEETGQQITGEALDYVYEQSKGQPWIVNSLFGRATMRVLDENSRETVTYTLNTKNTAIS